MSTLFVVGTLERSEVERELEQAASLFQRRVAVADVEALFERLYRDRLAASAVELDEKRWNGEEGVSVVVHSGGAAVSATLAKWFATYLPVVNLVAVDQGVGAGALRALLAEVREQSAGARDRVRRMAHWMYHGGSGGCSCRVYSIMRQLETAAAGGTPPAAGVPRAIRSIDFAALLGASVLDEQRCWRLLSTWEFEPHGLGAAELVYCAFVLLRRLAADAGVRLADNKLLLLLFTLEASYHQVNHFHNFRHAVDVMQATWRLCAQHLCDPAQVLLLSMAAIGHDIGHPGSNNMLLTRFDAPVAERYSRQSVLEHMHRDLFQGLLRVQWPQLLTLSRGALGAAAGCDLISETILATDMALHGAYVDKLKENHTIDNLRTLTSLIIKAADISNVTRPLAISARWACLITLEFRDCNVLQAYEEAKLQGAEPPEPAAPAAPAADIEGQTPGDLRLLSPEELVRRYPCIPGGQIYFIDTFAEQFFREFCQKFPHCNFLIENIQANKKFWLDKL